MRDRSHDPTTEAAPEAGRRDPRPSQAATARGRTPGSTGTALAAVALGAFVLVGDAGPAAAQHASAEAPQAETEVKAAAAAPQAETAVKAAAGAPQAERAAQPEKPGQTAIVPETAADAQEKSLYERLGGVYPIASVVDVFIDLLLHNDVLNENPAIREARDRVPAPGLKYHVTAMVCQATGGPCEYTGRSMDEAHAHLNIGEREWKAMLSDLRRTLNDFQVPEQEQEELIAIVETTKDAIVVED